MKRFICKPRNTEPFTVTIESGSIEDAAILAGHKLNGKKTITRRVTGDGGLSGMFQGYTEMKDGVLNSIGDNFHLREA